MEVVKVRMQPGSSYKVVSRNINMLIAEGYTAKQAIIKAHAFAAKATYKPEPVITIKLPVYKAKPVKEARLKATVKPVRKVNAKVVSLVAKVKKKPVKANRRVMNG